MRWSLALIVMLTLASVSFGEADTVDSAHDLLKDCQQLEHGAKGTGRHIRIPETKSALMCWGYMRAMQDMAVLAGENRQRFLQVCPSERTTLLQLIHAFTRYARSHADELEGNTAVVVIKALQDAFPCPEDKSQNGVGARLTRTR